MRKLQNETMSKTPHYTPAPDNVGSTVFASAMLKDDPEAWNLAWLSRSAGFGGNGKPDPQFTTHVRRTLQFELATGETDLINTLPAQRLVRGLLRLTPPAAVKRIVESPRVAEMPLYLAYGGSWLSCMSYWALQYREPFHPVHDAPVANCEQALQALHALK